MSGPKTSKYVLTAEQRRLIEEQQRMIRETKIAQEKKSKLCRKSINYLSDITSIIDELKRLYAELGMGKDELCHIEKKKADMKKQIDRIKKFSESASLDILKKENEYLEQLLIQMSEIQLQGKGIIKQISSEYKRQLSGIIAEGFVLSFTGLGADRRLKENPFIVKINEALKRIEGLELSSELMEKYALIRMRANEIKSVDFLENFCSMQVYPFVHECEFFRDHISEYEDLLSQYSYLTAELGEPTKLFVFSEDHIGRLKTEIARLNQAIMCQKEQEYISAAVDEAMIEMGYELIGERTVVKKSGKKFRNGLYTLEEGTAVNVTFSDSGQISMELGALDEADRTPTELEATDLADDMRAFCEDYATLEKKLAEKGIATKRIAILPPSVEYAQVFNTSDYKLKKPVEMYQREKKKTAAGKQLHKEG